jgi:hypothetical protein
LLCRALLCRFGCLPPGHWALRELPVEAGKKEFAIERSYPQQAAFFASLNVGMRPEGSKYPGMELWFVARDLCHRISG